MKTNRVLMVKYLLLSLFCGTLFTGCEPPAKIEGELQTITQPLAGPSPGKAPPSAPAAVGGAIPGRAVPGQEDGDDDDDDGAPLSFQQARMVVRAAAILQPAAGEAQAVPPAASVLTTEAFRRLWAKANETLQRAGVGASAEVQELPNLSGAERTVLRQQAEATLTSLSRDFSLAALDHALLRQATVEANLSLFAQDLNASLPLDKAIIPKESLALIPMPPPEVLEKAIEGLWTHRRQLRELAEVSRHPELESALKFVSEKITRLERVRDSAERRTFSAARGKIFQKIGVKTWAAQVGTRAQRIEPMLTQIRQKLETQTGYREIRLAANGVRGPPEPVADMVFQSLRAYDLDPGGWTRGQARLQALASELGNLPDVPQVLKQPPAGAYDQIAELLSPGKLEFLRGVNASIVAELSEDGPSDYLFVERRAHHREWQEALDREAGRRKAGMGVKSGPDNPDVKRLVRTYSPPPELPTRIAEARFLQVVSVRFPRRATMPMGLRNDVADVFARTLKPLMEQVETLLPEYCKVSDQLARSTQKVSPELMEQYRAAKSSAQAVAFHLERAIHQAESFQVDVRELKSRRRGLLALLPDDPGWQPPARPPALSQDPFSFRVNQISLERALHDLRAFLAEATTHLNSARELAKNLDTAPVNFSQQKGRLTVSESKLIQDKGVLTSAKPDRAKPRLRFAWTGRKDEKGDLYPFDEVKNPKRFRALGGGIHLGETASVTGAETLKGAALTFEPETGLVLRDREAGKRWVIADKTIHPTTLKALYRFAASGRNAAVSVGWGAERETLAEALARGKESQVLLDPFLVDTAVGQDLVLADLVPWKFDAPTLPDGSAITFHEKFGRLVKEYRLPAREKLAGFVKTVPPYQPSERASCIGKMERENAELPALIRAVWAFDDLGDEAFRGFLTLERKTLRAQLVESFKEEIRKDPKKAASWSKLSGSSLDMELFELAEKAISKQAAKFEEECRVQWSKLPKDTEETRRTLLEEWLITTMSRPDAPNRAAVECWVALQHKLPRSAEQIADRLLAYSNSLTLAVLRDERVQLTLRDDGGVTDSTVLRYFYGTSFVDVTEKHVGVTHAPGDPTTDVNPIAALSELVNTHVEALTKTYQPLRQIQRYAGLAAFFRWAINAEKSGALAVIDLGSLGEYSANDRERFPTPDSLRRDE